MINTKKFGEFSRLSFVDTTAQGYTPSEKKTQTGSAASMGNPTVGNREIDQELVERAQRGDKRAFGMLVDKYQRKLGRLLSRLVRDPAEVEDVVQESFIKAYRALPNFRGDSAFYTWLYRIATNECLTFLSSKKRKFFLPINDVAAELAEKIDSSADITGDEIQLKLQKALLKLPDKQRLVFNMKYYDELKYEEISEILGTSVGALKASYHLAVKKIEEFLKQD